MTPSTTITAGALDMLSQDVSALSTRIRQTEGDHAADVLAEFYTDLLNAYQSNRALLRFIQRWSARYPAPKPSTEKAARS